MIINTKLTSNTLKHVKAKVLGYTRKNNVDDADFKRIRNLVSNTIQLGTYCHFCVYDDFGLCLIDNSDTPQGFKKYCAPEILDYINAILKYR